MSRKNKKSSRKANPKTKKIATSIAQKTDKKNNIVWDVSQIDDDGKWGWRRVDCSFFFKEIWKKMRNFETATWDQIAGKTHHMIPVSSIITSAQKRLAELGHDDEVRLASFHINGKQRMWAIRRSVNQFYLLWWDPEHEICPSYKRHT